ncbi:MAG TPA: PQQ-dependent sugar dehydrogenase [Gemmatimonadaceae bacterium]
MRILAAVAASIAALAFAGSPPPTPSPCAPDNAGLKLPPGFCASLFADSLNGPRHLTVAPNGDVFVALGGSRNAKGGVAVLRDADGDGKAELRTKFGEFYSSEVQLGNGYLFAENGTAILRYKWTPGAMEPAGEPDTVVTGMPPGGHSAKTFLLRGDNLYVNQGSRTNSCQEKDRAPGVKGQQPCPELAERAGIWRYSATKVGQTPANGEHFAQGIRNAVGMAFEPGSGDLIVMQHGRDQLGDWPGYSVEKNAETPAEEMFRVTKGSDFGWPYCYFDPELKQKLQAPEYGGDGKTAGTCADKKGNIAFFPGHWAPETILFYTGSALPARYKNGAFVVFHGAWNRAPLPLQGFKVVFQPMARGRASGPFEVFADGFYSVENNKPTELGGRPMGLAQGKDGELYLSDDSKGRIFRITYTGK